MALINGTKGHPIDSTAVEVPQEEVPVNEELKIEVHNSNNEIIEKIASRFPEAKAEEKTAAAKIFGAVRQIAEGYQESDGTLIASAATDAAFTAMEILRENAERDQRIKESISLHEQLKAERQARREEREVQRSLRRLDRASARDARKKRLGL